MRVISGTAGRRRLKTPGGLKVRPTADRVKEALFNILGDRVPGSRFLDLFAGTGNVGIEALSRSAAVAVFVEKDIRNIRIIKENTRITGLERQAKLLCKDVLGAINFLGSQGQKFDIIFADPPYLKDLEIGVLLAIAGHGLLEPDGMVIIESNKKDLPPGDVKELKTFRQERYGDTLLSFYRYKETTGR